MESMLVFDRAAVRRHRDRAAASVGEVADLLRDGAERLLDRLDGLLTAAPLAALVALAAGEGVALWVKVPLP